MNYNAILNKHLYNFIHEVLESVERSGLGSNEHLLITFSTRHAGITLSKKLREVYPDELTIILDEEFYGLTADDSGFSVRLVFDETGEEKIYVPYSSIIAFEDPSCDFSIDLEPDLADISLVSSDNVISFADIKK